MLTDGWKDKIVDWDVKHQNKLVWMHLQLLIRQNWKGIVYDRENPSKTQDLNLYFYFIILHFLHNYTYVHYEHRKLQLCTPICQHASFWFLMNHSLYLKRIANLVNILRATVDKKKFKIINVEIFRHLYIELINVEIFRHLYIELAKS